MSTKQIMSPEAFVAWATAEIEIAKGESREAAVARLDNVRKQLDVAKSYSFEGDAEGLSVELVDTPAPDSTDVSPDKAQGDDPSSTTATNFDDVTKRLAKAFDALKKAIGGEDDGEGDGEDKGKKGDSESDVDKNDDPPGFAWPDDLNDDGNDLAWGSDGKSE
jgi:hypothetical protein